MRNRVALVTGASRGIGKACALALAGAGARVALAARHSDKLEEAAAEIRSRSGEAYVVELDLASGDSIKNAFASTAKEFGRIDILVNNAGITRDGAFVRMSDAQWEEVLSTNLHGAFRCCRAVARPMMKARYGRIVNVSSVVGLMGNAGQANYAASKAALLGLTKSLARELGGRSITVNAVCPGYIETDMTASLPESARSGLLERIPQLIQMGEDATLATERAAAAAIRACAAL